MAGDFTNYNHVIVSQIRLHFCTVGWLVGVERRFQHNLGHIAPLR